MLITFIGYDFEMNSLTVIRKCKHTMHANLDQSNSNDNDISAKYMRMVQDDIGTETMFLSKVFSNQLKNIP